MHKIVHLGAFPRAKNSALDRAFWCSPSCTKSWFLLLSLVPKIVLFGALTGANNRALYRAFWCSPSCQNSCFLVLSFVHCSPLSKHHASRSCFLVLSIMHKIVVFVVVHHAKNCAFWCSPSCHKPCSRSCFWCSPSCIKIMLFGASPSCRKSCFLVLSLMPKIML